MKIFSYSEFIFYFSFCKVYKVLKVLWTLIYLFLVALFMMLGWSSSNKIQFLVFLGWVRCSRTSFMKKCITVHQHFFSIANLLFKVIKHLEKYYCVNMNGKNWTKKGHWVTLYYELIISNYHAMIFHCYTLFSISKLCPKKYSKIP